MILTSLNDTFIWYSIRCDVHTVAKSTNGSKCVSRIQFKHGLVMGRPLQLCTSGKLHVFHDDDRPGFPMKESVKLSTMALITLL